MRSRAEVYWDYNNAINQAGELESIAGEIDRLVKRQGDTLMNLQYAWVSTHATRYLSKANQLKTSISNQAQNLRNTASTIREAAARVRDAEIRAIEIAEENARREAEEAEAAAAAMRR